MTTQEIIQNIPSELFNEDGNTPLTRILVRDGSITPLPEPYLFKDNDQVYDYSKNNGFVELTEVDVSDYQREFITAEEWISEQGYTPTRIVTLMDLENKLRFVNKTSQKVAEVRLWLDTILAEYIINTAPRNDWPAAPYLFEQTVLDAYNELTSQ